MLSETDLAKEYLETLLRTQRFSPADLQAYQAEILGHLLRHATAEVPFYRNLNIPNGPLDFGSQAWLQIPTINRRTLAEHSGELRARHMPQGHGGLRYVSSGGTTGKPIQVALSDLELIGRVVCTYRMFTDYDMNVALPLFMIRKQPREPFSPSGLVSGKWGYPWLTKEELGDRVLLDIRVPAGEQLDQLQEREPAYVNTLPSDMLRLGVEARRRGRSSPSIPAIISVAEYLPAELRSLAEETFGSRVVNILPSSEGGVIAIRCPESENLHIQSEIVLAEILDEAGRPCEPGDTGELVVTPLYNYGMPLIRYRSGDFVVQGGLCSCGRSLPTIERFVGRKEHLFDFPDGSWELPRIDRVKITELLGHDAWQFVQTGGRTAELRHEPSVRINEASDAIREHLTEAVGRLLSIDIREVPQLGLTSGGKRHFTVNAVSARQAPEPRPSI